MMRTNPIIAVTITGFFLVGDSIAQPYEKQHQGKQPKEAESFHTQVPQVPLDVILGCPTEDSITLNIRSAKEILGAVHCGKKKIPFSLKEGETQQILLNGLSKGAHQYRIGDLKGSFQLARQPGESFTFTIQADSHLDGSCIPELYKTMLGNVIKDKPDFHIDLGDTFMTGKHATKESAIEQYLAQRYYFGLIGNTVPVFLVLGNHDGEEIKKDGEIELAIWSRAMRKKYFSNPEPNKFYTGNQDKSQNYYAWQWSDALFVVLDPYTYSTSTRGGRSMENMKLGDQQFEWLEKVLRESNVKYKFIFIHQLTGGLGSGNRGGAEAAKLHQWSRVHDLLQKHRASVVFHGHDHFYAKQERDGIIYQLVPQGTHRNSKKHFADEYGYIEGDFLPNNGHLRVTVSPTNTTISYINAALKKDSNEKIKAQYTIPPK